MRTTASNIVTSYLAFVNERKAGPSRSPEWIGQRIEQITAELQATGISWMVRLRKTQRLHDLIDEREALDNDPTEDFVKVCTAWSVENGIDDSTWRECGVPASVLRRADEYAAGKGAK